MKKINIGLLGCGTVGTGVAKILTNNKDLISSRVGGILNLKSVAEIDTKTDREIQFDDGVLNSDTLKVVDDPEIDIIIEAIGGQEIAKDMILRSIDNGKQVVTANKALLAEHANILFKAAADKNVDLAFEASVGGCMPIIKTIRESLVANHIKSMIGILNGTCNYILSEITQNGSQFEAALAEAQSKGYAEAEPSLDVEGIDTAHKLAILTSLAYNTEVNLKDIFVEGISSISPVDIEYAEQFGYRIKLLAINKDRGNAVEARVHPTMIPSDNLMSNVRGTLNAITISGDAVGDDIMLTGHGAGMMPTASAVVADTVELARNLLSSSASRIPLFSYLNSNIKKIPILPIEEIFTHYYFRFSALDRPGVLSKIAGILGNFGISIKSVHQKGRKTQGTVPIVMLTHLAREADMKDALNQISSLDIISGSPVVIRIENQEPSD